MYRVTIRASTHSAAVYRHEASWLAGLNNDSRNAPLKTVAHRPAPNGSKFQEPSSRRLRHFL
jgi:hypothetical protein